MVRGLVTAAMALLLAVSSADAGLFGRKNDCGCAAPVVSSCGGCDNGCGSYRRVKVRKSKNRGCCAPASYGCSAPVSYGCSAPAYAAPAPACGPVCAPVATCSAPAASCCAPAAYNACGPAGCGPAGCAPAGGYAAPAPVAPAAVPAPPENGALANPPKPENVN
ncbi:MAG TPA: hypothetical protein VFG20_02975 [Planctomycetaceae bacterium]|jgi:hypothetical protein|nr:hypothetical protein [Planctomycetaceae bacterium]